jgi:mono/diheme cytochrome c family protein
MSVKLVREFVGAFLLAIAIVSAGACSKPGPQTAESKAITNGRKLYAANCASCHNPTNPNLPGSVGPPIAGAPQDLIADRVLHRSYPPGYKPKRNTHLMKEMPWLAPNIGDLAAFLEYEAKNDSAGASSDGASSEAKK